jgi:hypothetical protein
MKLSKNSKKLITFLNKNDHINYVTQTKHTNTILSELYGDIKNAYNYLLSLKQSNKQYYTIYTQKIDSSLQITKPKSFNSNSFPEIVRKQIDENSVYEICYTFSLFEREIKIYFVLEEMEKIEKYNKHVDIIIMWLYILNQYSSKQCANSLIIYFYFTSLEKTLPYSNIQILGEINVNTAFTTTCPRDSEIVVFRKEEWFKVLIHETFHNFGLDFSDMNNEEVHKCILNIFKVRSDVNLYESYTEFWAEIINAVFCSFISLDDKNNVDDFLYNFEIFINYERTYSFFQLIKILNFMGLTYSDLYSVSEHSRVFRENLYKEKSNVLSYYIIKTILINNYQSFLLWCKKNNLSLLQFKKTYSNQKEYCRFIEQNYKTKSMLYGIDHTYKFLKNIYFDVNSKKIKKNKSLNFLLSNLRMSICELG